MLLYWIVFPEFVLEVCVEESQWIQGHVLCSKDVIKFPIGMCMFREKSNVVKLLHEDKVQVVEQIPYWWKQKDSNSNNNPIS